MMGAVFAGIAQLVEQRTRNAQVMGSSPFAGSTVFLLPPPRWDFLFLPSMELWGAGAAKPGGRLHKFFKIQLSSGFFIGCFS